MPETSRIVKLDARGEICPVPLMRAQEAMKAAGEGVGVEVVTDHRPALITVPSEAVKKGWDVNIQRTGPSEWRILLTRSAWAEGA